MSSIVIAGDTSGSVTLQAPAVAGTTTLTLPATSGTMLTTASTTGISGSAISSGTVAEAYGGTGTTSGYYGFKNRIINGAMVIDQRNSGAEVNPAVSFDYYLDRWFIKSQQSGKFKIGQNAGAVTPPTGFIKYLGITSLAATTVGASDAYQLRHNIEGFNVSDLGWGTANAQTVTLSFRVYSSLTGTFGGALRNSADNRSYPFSYSIPTANTWTTISITIAGDTSGTWLTDNGIGIQLLFSLGVGSTLSGTAGAWAAANYQSATGAVNVVGTSGATWYITGVQLEKGSTATSFDVRSYGTELALCQRYFWKGGLFAVAAVGSGKCNNATDCNIYIAFPVPMRSSPTTTQNTMEIDTGATTISYSTVNLYASTTAALYNITGNSGFTAGNAVLLRCSANSSFVAFSSEL